MNPTQLIARVLTLASLLSLSACTTVVEKKEPTVSSTTTTEETHVHPMRGPATIQTTTTETR